VRTFLPHPATDLFQIRIRNPVATGSRGWQPRVRPGWPHSRRLPDAFADGSFSRTFARMAGGRRCRGWARSD
jgi:hypothetical protein